MPWWRSRAAIAGCAALGGGLILAALLLGIRTQPETVGGQPVECPSVISEHVLPGGEPGADDACGDATLDDLLVVIDVAAVGLAVSITAVVLHFRRRLPARGPS
jgi:hypothetical protein